MDPADWRIAPDNLVRVLRWHAPRRQSCELRVADSKSAFRRVRTAATEPDSVCHDLLTDPFLVCGQEKSDLFVVVLKPTNVSVRPTTLRLVGPIQTALSQPRFSAQPPRLADNVEARFFRVTPNEKSDLKSRSKDTEGSPDSILANLDWLVWSAAATAA